MEEDLNLIKHMNYLRKIFIRFDSFIEEEVPNSDDGEITLDNMRGLKEGYAQIKWTEEVYLDMFDMIKNIKAKFEEKMKPILSKLEYTATDNVIDKHNQYAAVESFKMPIFNIFSSPLENLAIGCENWEETQEYYNSVEEIALLKNLGYPGGINNINPLKRVLFNSFRNCVGVPNLTETDQILSTEKSDSKVSSHVIGEYKYKCSNMEIMIPVIDSIPNIPPNIYYFQGDKMNKKGVYCRTSRNLIVKIPMMDVVSENADNSRQMTVKCNNGKDCGRFYCTYTHPGVPYNKIGYTRRCPSHPRFSNSSTLETDIDKVDYEDIRMCLMYFVTDMFAVNAWCQRPEHNVKKSMIVEDIDLCGTYVNPLISDNQDIWTIVSD